VRLPVGVFRNIFMEGIMTPVNQMSRKKRKQTIILGGYPIEAQNVVVVAARLGAQMVLRERKVNAERGKHYFAINPSPTSEECLRLLRRTISAITGEVCFV